MRTERISASQVSTSAKGMTFLPACCPKCRRPAHGRVDSVVAVLYAYRAGDVDQEDLAGPVPKGVRVEYGWTEDTDLDAQRALRSRDGKVRLVCAVGHAWWARETGRKDP